MNTQSAWTSSPIRRRDRPVDAATNSARSDRWVQSLAIVLLVLTMLYATIGLPGFDTADASDTDHVNPLNSQIWLGLLILATPVLRQRWREALKLVTANWALLALMAYFALSVTWALDPQASMRRVLFMLVQFTLLVIILSAIRRAPAVHLVIAAVCIVAALADLVLWIVAPGYAMAADGFTGLQSQKNQAGLLMMYGCLSAFPCVFLLRERLWQGTILVSTIVMAVLLVATRSTTSQSVVISAALVMPMLSAVARRPRRVIIATVILVMLLPVAALLGYIAWCGVTGSDLMKPLEGVNFSERTPIWALVISEIFKRPWFGTGYSSLWAIDPRVQPSLSFGPWFGVWPGINEGHQGYLDLLATGGLIGLAGGLFVLLRAIVLAGKAVSAATSPELEWRDGDMARPTAIFHLSFLLGLVVHNFTESNLFTNNGLLAVAFMLCMLDLDKWRLARRRKPAAR